MTHAAVLSRPKERRAYQPFGAARRAWRSRQREALLSGPAGTGKSRLWLEKLHYCADKYPGMRGLIVRKTRQSITQTAMVTYEQRVLPEGWLDTLIHFRTQEQEYRYPNGSIIAVGGIDKPSKIMSSEWDFIYVMEATELSEDDLESLTTRLRNGVMPYQQLGMDCNPSYPTHWLKQRCDRGATLMLESRHEDNPSVTPEYMATLDALTGVRKKRLRDGIWAAAEGLVYEEYDPAIHKVSLSQLIAWQILTPDGKINKVGTKRVIVGKDWGWTNPGTSLVFALDSDSRLYLVREVYQTQRTDDWWLERDKKLKQEYGAELYVCDPAMPAYIAKYKASGLNALEADNDIAAGVNDMRERLQIAGDGRPRFYIYDDALRERDESRVDTHQPFCLDGEILEYVWPKAQDGKPIKEVPVPVNNHSCLVSGTLVKTDHGDVSIEQIRADDLVLTRFGYRRVKAAGMTAERAKVYTLTCSNGTTLTGTGNHPVYVHGKGYTPLHAMRYGDIIETPEKYIERSSLVCHQDQNQRNQRSFTIGALPIDGIPTLRTGQIVSTTIPIAAIGKRDSSEDYINKSGVMHMGLFQRDTTFTTRMKTRLTTHLKTWNVFQGMIIGSIMEHSRQVLRNFNIWKMYGISHLNGINQKWEGHGIADWVSRRGNMLSMSLACVNIAAQNFKPSHLGLLSDSALTTVNQRPVANQGLIMSRGVVNDVERHIPATSTVSNGSAHKNVASVTVLSLSENEEEQAVYNLTVDTDTVGEYFANGILVHNCDASRYVCRWLGSGVHTGSTLMRELSERKAARETVKEQLHKKMQEAYW